MNESVGTNLMRPRAHISRAAFLALLVSALVALCMALPLRGLAAETDDASPAQDVAQEAATLRAFFLDVGQGDSEFIELPDGKTMLIDAGENGQGEGIARFVQESLGHDHIDYVVATHPHSDHIGGLPAVLATLPAGQVIAPEASNDTETFERFLDAVDAAGMQITAARAGLVVDEAPDLRVEVISPAEGAVADDLNDVSAVIKVTWGATSFLFCGDASYQVVEGANPGHVDVLKVGHHGSDTATSIPLLETLAPSIAVIEVGRDNSYGHPTTETLDELASCGVQTWRTDVDGTVEVDSDGTSVSAHALPTGATTPATAAPAAEAVGDEGAEAEQVQTEAAEGQPEAATETVYVTETGTKYHHDGCSYLKKSKIAIPLEDAQAQGYEPCSRCF